MDEVRDCPQAPVSRGSHMQSICISLHKNANTSIGLAMIRTAILGASGYVGGELLRLISGHPELRAARLFGDSKAGQTAGQVHPHLAAAYPDAIVEKFDGALE